MTPTPSPDPARYVSPVCRDGSHQACANFRGTCRCTCHAAAGEGTERPGGWRKKPVEVEARQVHYANRFDVAAWCGGEAQDAAPSGNVYAPGLLSINTLEGKMWASEGDWIIRGVKGEFYPCKPDIFAATYEPATPQPPVPPSPAIELLRQVYWRSPETAEWMDLNEAIADLLRRNGGIHTDRPVPPAPAPSTPGEGAGRPNTAQRLAPTPFETWSAGMFTGSVLAAQGRPVRSFSEDEIRSEFTSWLEEWVYESGHFGTPPCRREARRA